MIRKIKLIWTIETLMDCALVSTIFWVNKIIAIGNYNFNLSTILATVGITMLFVNTIIYSVLIKNEQTYQEGTR